jgi:antitoxin ParD1/3/4
MPAYQNRVNRSLHFGLSVVSPQWYSGAAPGDESMNDQMQFGPEDEAFIEDAVKSGRYASREEVVRECLHALRERGDEVAALRAAVQRGIEDADAGRLIDAEEAFDRLDEHIRNMPPSAKAKRRA